MIIHHAIIILLTFLIDPLFLILEFAVHGKLQSYLRERRAQRSQPSGEGGSVDALTARDLTAFAYQVARGMEYLSSKGVIFSLLEV